MKHLLPEKNWYKASLHTHSTVSDGKLTPQEVKALYKAKGYHVLALTDHHVISDHPELNDEDFLTLTSIELGFDSEDYAPPQSFYGQTFHFNLIAKDPDNMWQPYPPKTVKPTNQEFVERAHWDQRQRICSLECVNEVLRRAKEEGFLSVYNHPVWSGQHYPEYMALENLWGLEIRNTHNVMMGYDDNNSHVYRDMLHGGKRLCVVAADDTHRPHTIGGAWTMISAGELSYGAIIEAMEKGDLYATCGPLIHSLTLDGNILRLTFTEAREVALQTNARFARRCAGENGALITEAEFDLSTWFEKNKGDTNGFIRLTVTAADGTYAATRAYWLEELQ